MKKADVIIIVTLLAIALGAMGVSKLFFNHKYAVKYVEIYENGKLYQKILIKDNAFKKTIKVTNKFGTNIVQIENGGARMLDADCPDKICIKEGFIDKNGQTIVCLPNRFVVEIKGEDKAETDEVSY
jgi:hypothetical protein